MKKINVLVFTALLFVCAFPFLTSCEKEVDSIIMNESSGSLDIEGILQFDSYNDLTQTAEMLNMLPFEELEIWCKNRSFMSQELLFRNLIIEEDIYNELISLKYENIENPIDVLLLDGLKLYTDIYYELLANGIIRQVEESDGSSSYKSTVINPVYMSVIDEHGLVIVGNEIYQFFDEGIKIIHDGNMDKIPLLNEIKKSDEKEGISVIYLTSSLKGYGHSFNKYDEEIDGRYRVTFQVYFYAGAEGVYYPNPGTCLTTTYYTEARAQKKNIFGSWVYRNNFTPITEVTGTWSYYFKLVEVGNPYNYQYIYSVTDSDSQSSPFTYNFGGGSSNYLKTTFIPDGTFCASSGWLMDECVVYNYSYRMKSDGFPDITF